MVEQQHNFIVLHLVFVGWLMTNLFTTIKCTNTKLKIKKTTDQNSFAFLALLNRTITTTARIFYSTWSLPLTRHKIHHINITLVTHCLICKKITICVSLENTKKYDTFLTRLKFPFHASVRQNPGSWYETTFMLLYISA